MKRHLFGALRAFASSLCSCALGVLFLSLMLSLYDELRTVSIPFERAALMLAILALINEALVTRGVPALLYGFVNLLAGGAGVCAVLRGTVFTPASGGYAVFLGALLLLSVVHCAAGAVKPPDSNQFIWLADMLIVGLLLLLACAHLLDHALDGGAVGFALIALAAAFASTSSLRCGGESDRVVRGSGMGGYLVLAGMLALCLVLTAALISLGGGQVDGVVFIVSRLWQLMGALFERVILLFSALLSLNLGKYNPLRREVGNFTATVIALDDPQAAGTAPVWIVYAFLALLGAALLAVILGFLLDFRGMRAERKGKKQRRRVVTRKSHLLSALLALLRAARERVSFELALRRSRLTPQAVYVLALRLCRAKALKKRPAESPGAYLGRLHAQLTAMEAPSTLDRLAAQLNAALYGGEHVRLSAEEYAQYAAQLRTLARGKKEA